jgi:HTH-type transcriptional regulator/antitoxin HigA
MTTDLTPAEAFPPGEFLLDELGARGWSQIEFAEIIGRSAKVVNEIITGKRSITPATAKALGAAFGQSPQYWMNLEAAYQLWREEPAPARIARKASLRSVYPVRELIQRGWIEPSESAEVLETRVLSFFQVKTLNEKPQLRHAAKRTALKKLEQEVSTLQLAWLFRVKQIANAMRGLPEYSETKLIDALPQLRALMGEPEEIRHVPRILADCGVRLVIVKPLPSAKIDGVCLWLDEERPIIGMSLRFDRIDNFWHVLRHEIEHVIRGDGQDWIDIELGPESDIDTTVKEELAATKAAEEFGVPTAELENFIARVGPLYSEFQVTGFARRLNVHPGIAVGRLQRKLNKYDMLRKLLVGIRDLIVPVAMADGYGTRHPLTA